MSDRAAALLETLDALEMPPDGLRTWFLKNLHWYTAHGGRRYYAELMDLYHECLALLERRDVP